MYIYFTKSGTGQGGGANRKQIQGGDMSVPATYPIPRFKKKKSHILSNPQTDLQITNSFGAGNESNKMAIPRWANIIVKLRLIKDCNMVQIFFTVLVIHAFPIDGQKYLDHFSIYACHPCPTDLLSILPVLSKSQCGPTCMWSVVVGLLCT